MNAYETLGLSPQLVIDEDALRDAFREAGKVVHPDAGGGEEAFASLREAFDMLASPSRRLRHWLELRGILVDARGPVDAALMDLFTQIGAVSQRAEALIRRRDEARTALVRAMLENEAQTCREAVEQALHALEAAISEETRRFPEIECATSHDPGALAVAVRHLAFLEKWRQSLRGLFSRLV